MQKIFTALLTPFNESGNILEGNLRELVRYNLEVNQVDGLYVGGSTGENFLLNIVEKKNIFKVVKEEAGDKADLIAQIGALNIYEAKELARYVVDELGYKTISAVTPFYYKFNFSEIKNYYDELVADVNAEMIVYAIPALTGVSFTEEEFDELFQNPKITGVKYTAGDFFLMERIRKRFPDKKLYSGFDEMLLPAAAIGIDGAIGSTFNVNGRRAKNILKAVESGDLVSARQYQNDTNDLISAVIDNGLYNTLKLMLSEAGVPMGYCRLPMEKYTDAQSEKAKQLYLKYM